MERIWADHWRRLLAVAAILLLSAVLAPKPAQAGIDWCTVSVSGGIAFSPYNTQTKAAVDGTGTISVTCQGDSNNTLSLNITGGNTNQCQSSTAGNGRQMRSGTNNLNYQIYRDAARTLPFCDGGNRLDIDMNFPTPGRITRTFPMYGRVFASQNPVYQTGSYSDPNLTVTVKRGGGNLHSTNFSVTGSVAAICSISAGTLGFGAYSGTAVNASAGVTVNCSNGAGYQVSLGGGSNLSGGTRRMAGPLSSFLSYQLFRDSARLVPWGDGSAQLGARLGGTGSGAAQSLTVYGRIPAGQSPAAGNYSDSVTVTIEY